MEENVQRITQEILEYLKGHQVLISPVSYREICDELGVSSTSMVSFYLDILEKQGKIRRDPFKFRHIEVIE